MSLEQSIWTLDHRVSIGFLSLSDDFGIIVVGFKTRSIDIPSRSDKQINRDENKHFRYLVNYKFHSYEDRSSDEYLKDDGSFSSAPEDTRRHDPRPHFSVIEHHSRKDFKLLTDRKYHKQFSNKPH